MKAKLILSYLLVLLPVIFVNSVFYYVIKDPFQRLWISALAGIVVGMALGIFISRTLTRGISNLVQVTREITAGDLTKQVAVRNADGEIGELAGAFQRMLDELKNMVGQVKRSVETLTGSAKSFSGTTEQMSASAQEIAAATEHIAKGAELQVSCVERSAARTRQIAGSIEKITSRAREVAESSTAAGYTAQHGGEATAAALAKMEKVFRKIEGSTEMIHGFGERTQRIGKIIEVITGISQQTNLLALNATIEAARAGEYGKGFAVVADEIRKLSEKTQKSAKEITALVEEIALESTKVLTSMEAGNLEVKEGREVIDTVRQSLDDIINVTIDAAKGVQEISTLTEEQNRSADEMVKATDEISKIAEDNAAATEEASAATEEMTASMEQMATSAQDLAALSDDLRRAVARFTVDGSRDRAASAG